MHPQFRRVHYIVAGVAFLAAFVTYLCTMQPTIPFWDCGEFIASAAKLQVSHPPGAPLWMLVGHVAAWLVPVMDIAAKYNVLSALCGALSSMLLYLVAVKVIRIWRKEPISISDAIIHFGGAFIAALSFTWSDSVWFNSNEFIVFSPGLLFIAIMIWLAMIWHERADQPGNERYLMLIAFMIGLSMGVHQMSMLAFFPVWAIVFYRHWGKITMRSFLSMLALGILFFVYIFKVVLSGLVSWAGSGMGVVSLVIIIGIIGGIYYTSRPDSDLKDRRGILNLLLWGGAMVLLGFSVYTYVMIRGGQNTPIDEGAPNTFSKLSEYIGREQYGTVSLSDEIEHRRLPKESGAYKPETWENYSSDADFFWQYQTRDMFLRYLAWNFIGRNGDYQGANVAFDKTWALPFFLGLFGIYLQFKRDPRRGMVFLLAFLVMGLFTAWYQDQQDPQPRERDYFYVGAFWVYAMWVGIGAVGIMEWFREKYSSWNTRKMSYGLAGAFGLLVLFGPINQCIGLGGLLQGESFKKSSKWAEYSRKHNWIPFEYAYNILQSCEPNAILFTYGDNDTFPLWCIQDAYGIRRDVRIVQLQLATMMWNIKQLKTDNAWGGKAITLTNFTDEILKLSDDEAYKKLEWNPSPVNMPISAETARWISGDPRASATVFNWVPKFVMPSDQVVLDIIKNNLGTRPICYSVTVPENTRAGLNKYLIYEGLTARVTPFEQPVDQNGLGGSIQPARFSEAVFHVPSKPHSEPDRGMILHTYADPEANWSSLDDEYSLSYRYEFIRLANWDVTQGNMEEARRALDSMEVRVPLSRIPLDYSFSSFVADLADKSGDWPIMKQYAAAGVNALKQQLQNPDSHESSSGFQASFELANLEMRSGDYAQARRDFETLITQSKTEQQSYLRLKALECGARKLESERQYDSAYREFSEILGVYGPSTAAGPELQDVRTHLAFDSAMRGK
jgi:tetratricopeptide (TPR) repeat protein